LSAAPQFGGSRGRGMLNATLFRPNSLETSHMPAGSSLQRLQAVVPDENPLYDSAGNCQFHAGPIALRTGDGLRAWPRYFQMSRLRIRKDSSLVASSFRQTVRVAHRSVPVRVVSAAFLCSQITQG
jgi:hypothetical protein